MDKSFLKIQKRSQPMYPKKPSRLTKMSKEIYIPPENRQKIIDELSLL